MITNPVLITELLQQFPLFKNVPGDALAGLASQCRIDAYQNGQIIFKQGDPGDRFWIVWQGRVKIVRCELDGREVILEIIPAGEIFGGGSIFLPENPGSAMAISNVKAVSFSQQVYIQFLLDQPEISINLIKMLGSRLHSLMEMQMLGRQRVEQRLSNILLKMVNHAGQPHPEGILITIPLSRQDLADLAGTTLETAIRTISRMRTQGILKSLRGGYLLILDIDLLRKLAGS